MNYKNPYIKEVHIIETDIQEKIDNIKTYCNKKYIDIAKFLAYYLYTKSLEHKTKRFRIKETLSSFLGLTPNELRGVLFTLYKSKIIIDREFDNSFYSYITICSSNLTSSDNTIHIIDFNITPHLIGYAENKEFIYDYLSPVIKYTVNIDSGRINETPLINVKTPYSNLDTKKLLIEVKQLEDKNDELILENRKLKDRVKLLEEIIKTF